MRASCALQSLQSYIDDGLVEYHWVDKAKLGPKKQPMPPQLQVRSVFSEAAAFNQNQPMAYWSNSRCSEPSWASGISMCRRSCECVMSPRMWVWVILIWYLLKACLQAARGSRACMCLHARGILTALHARRGI